MDQRKNNISLAFGVPGVALQLGSLCLTGFISSTLSVDPDLVAVILLACILIGTAMLMIGLAFYAEAKGHSAAWCLAAFLGIIGLIILAALPDRHSHAMRVRSLPDRVSDVPTDQSLGFFCLGCGYRLNAIVGNACPECGRGFNPEDLTTVRVEGLEQKDPPWMGRWSLICGILGIILTVTLFCGPIFGIVGIAFGHSARATILKERRPGAGVALAGLITSYSAIALSILFIFTAFILPQIVSSMAP